MSRTNARKNAFCLLFQLDFVNEDEYETAKRIFFEETKDMDEADREFTAGLVEGACERLGEIDEIIGRHSKGWTVERMSKVDLAILRLAVFELMFSDKTPKSVVINEAVELAKKYSSDEAPSFVNGILGQIIP